MVVMMAHGLQLHAVGPATPRALLPRPHQACAPALHKRACAVFAAAGDAGRRGGGSSGRGDGGSGRGQGRGGRRTTGSRRSTDDGGSISSGDSGEGGSRGRGRWQGRGRGAPQAGGSQWQGGRGTPPAGAAPLASAGAGLITSESNTSSNSGPTAAISSSVGEEEEIDVLLVPATATQRPSAPSFDDPPPQLAPEDAWLRRAAGLPPGRTATRLRHERMLSLTPSDGRPSSRRLSAMIAVVQSLERLERLVGRHGESMEPIHLTAALTELERLILGGEGDSRSDTGAQQQRGPSSGSVGSSEGGGRDSGGGGEQTLAEGPLMFSSPGQQRRAAALVTRLGHLLLRTADSADGQSLAVTMRCLGRFGARDMRLASELMLVAAVRAGQLNGQGLAMVLSGAVALHLRPQPGVLSQLLSRLAEAAPSLGSQALANAVWAAARLQPPELPSRLLQALEARMRRLLPQMAPQHVAMAMWGLARLKARPSDWFLETLWRHSGRQLSSYCPQDLGNLAWATAEMGAAPPDPWAVAFCRRCQQRLGAFEPQGVVQVAYALARWDFLRGRKAQKGQVDQQQQQQQQSTEQQQSNAVTSKQQEEDEALIAAAAAASRREAQSALVAVLLDWSGPRLAALPSHELADLVIAMSWLVPSAAGAVLPEGWAAAAASAANRAADARAAGGAPRLRPRKAQQLAGAVATLRAL